MKVLSNGLISQAVENQKLKQQQNHTSEKNLLHPLFTDEAVTDMILKKIPNFDQLYQDLKETRFPENQPLSAISFLPALRSFSVSKKEIEKFLVNPETNHVVAQTDNIKIVLIGWNPGAEADIHGHASGGCVLKVLHGAVQEKRYHADNEGQLLSESTYLKDHIAYIDDVMGYHSVANPFTTAAVTLHLYTPGNYKGNSK